MESGYKNIITFINFFSEIEIDLWSGGIFPAPNTLLMKLKNIDSKAVKLAIGVPVHTHTSKSYAEAGMISLSEQRKLAISKYVIRSLAVINSVTEDFFIFF